MNFSDYSIREIENYFNRDKKHLVQYYKITKYPCPFNAKGCKRIIRKGMFVAIPVDENIVAISWSSCNPKDFFRPHFGWIEAYRKIQSIEPVAPPKDIRIKKAYERFVNRCKRYYKDKELAIF